MPDEYDDLLDSIAPAKPKSAKPSNRISFQPESSDWSVDKVGELQDWYKGKFGSNLPVTNVGQGSVHNRLGYDHRSSSDVSLRPDTNEGKQFMDELRTRNVPFLAFSGAVPGVSTGPHIHVGRPSSRTSTKYGVGAQVKTKPAKVQDEYDQLLDSIGTIKQPTAPKPTQKQVGLAANRRSPTKSPRSLSGSVTAGISGAQGAEPTRVPRPEPFNVGKYVREGRQAENALLYDPELVGASVAEAKGQQVDPKVKPRLQQARDIRAGYARREFAAGDPNVYLDSGMPGALRAVLEPAASGLGSVLAKGAGTSRAVADAPESPHGGLLKSPLNRMADILEAAASELKSEVAVADERAPVGPSADLPLLGKQNLVQLGQRGVGGLLGSSLEMLATMAGVPAPVAFGAGAALEGLGEDKNATDVDLLTRAAPAAAMGSLFDLAPLVPGVRNLGPVAQRAAKGGMVAAGTYPLERAFGASPEQASEAALVGGAFAALHANKPGERVAKPVERMADKANVESAARSAFDRVGVSPEATEKATRDYAPLSSPAERIQAMRGQAAQIGRQVDRSAMQIAAKRAEAQRAISTNAQVEPPRDVADYWKVRTPKGKVEAFHNQQEAEARLAELAISPHQSEFASPHLGTSQVRGALNRLPFRVRRFAEDVKTLSMRGVLDEVSAPLRRKLLSVYNYPESLRYPHSKPYEAEGFNKGKTSSRVDNRILVRGDVYHELPVPGSDGLTLQGEFSAGAAQEVRGLSEAAYARGDTKIGDALANLGDDIAAFQGREFSLMAVRPETSRLRLTDSSIHEEIHKADYRAGGLNAEQKQKIFQGASWKELTDHLDRYKGIGWDYIGVSEKSNEGLASELLAYGLTDNFGLLEGQLDIPRSIAKVALGDLIKGIYHSRGKESISDITKFATRTIRRLAQKAQREASFERGSEYDSISAQSNPPTAEIPRGRGGRIGERAQPNYALSGKLTDAQQVKSAPPGVKTGAVDDMPAERLQITDAVRRDPEFERTAKALLADRPSMTRAQIDDWIRSNRPDLFGDAGVQELGDVEQSRGQEMLGEASRRRGLERFMNETEGERAARQDELIGKRRTLTVEGEEIDPFELSNIAKRIKREHPELFVREVQNEAFREWQEQKSGIQDLGDIDSNKWRGQEGFVGEKRQVPPQYGKGGAVEDEIAKPHQSTTQRRVPTGQFDTGGPDYPALKTELRDNAAQLERAYKEIAGHRVRRDGLASASSSQARDYLAKLRSVVAATTPDKLDLVAQAKSAYLAGNNVKATIFAERALSSPHDTANQVQRAVLAIDTLARGKTPPATTAWMQTVTEMRQRAKTLKEDRWKGQEGVVKGQPVKPLPAGVKAGAVADTEPKRKERSLPKSLGESGRETGTDLFYDVLPNPESKAAAVKRVADEGVVKTHDWLTNAPPSAERTATFIELSDRYLKASVGVEGDAGKAFRDKAVELANTEAPRSTELGQAVQAYTMLDKYTGPEVLLTATKLADAAGKKLPDSVVKSIAEAGQEFKEADTQLKAARDMLKEAEKAPQGKTPAEQATRRRRIEKLRDAQAETLGRRAQARARQVDTLDALERRNHGYWMRMMNVLRGLMVSPIPTGQRNLSTQQVRIGLERMANVFAYGLRKAAGQDVMLPNFWSDLKRQYGGLHPKLGPSPRLLAKQILAERPRELAKLFGVYGSGGAEVASGKKTFGGRFDRALGSVEHRVQQVGWYTSTVEFHQRAAEFLTNLDFRISREYRMSLEDFVRRNGADQIPAEMITDSTNHALQVTFAEAPAVDTEIGRTMNAFIKAGNAIPPTVSAIPFARFFFNSWKMTYQFSPLGAADLLWGKQAGTLRKGSPVKEAQAALLRAERRPAGKTAESETGRLAGIAKAKSMLGRATENNKQERAKIVAKSAIGTAMLLTAYGLRSSDLAGEKWYELGGIDMRSFAPFSNYLFIAEAARRFKAGERPFSFNEFLQAIGTSTAITGGAATLYDKYRRGDIDGWARALQTEVGELGRGILAPVNQIKTLLGQFDEQETIVRDTSSQPFLGPIREAIPYASRIGEDLPPAYRPTSDKPIADVMPALQFAPPGARFLQDKNFFEHEADRLKFDYSEIFAATGVPEADGLMKKWMGEYVAGESKRLAKDQSYQREGDATKAHLYLQPIAEQGREYARERLAGERPDLYDKVQEKKKPARRKAMEKEMGISAVPTFIPQRRADETDVGYRARLLQVGRARRTQPVASPSFL